MLNQELKNQLTEVFKDLNKDISLVMKDSNHDKQEELKLMLQDLASCSQRISLKESSDWSSDPEFSLTSNLSPTGVIFQGVPGGHEFTSLVLAILNASGKGKLPDENLQKRIKKLRNIEPIRTYISLSCENCPDVVQNLNLIAIINGSVSHTMVDGELVPDELKSLNISGVPSVFIGNKMLHSGRASLADLLQKLEAHSGIEDTANESSDLGIYDVAILGGGPAGISAAIYAARKGLKTVIVAVKLGGLVTETKGIENFISAPYTEGPELVSQLDKHLRSYPIDVLEHRRIASVQNGVLKRVILKTGESFATKAVIIATGAKWRELNIPGEKEYLGRGVAFCPHCDGPFYKDKDIAVIGGGNSGVEAAIDLAGICRNVTLLEFADSLKADAVLINKLHSLKNIKIITSAQSDAIEGNGSKVSHLHYIDRHSQEKITLELDGIFVQIGLNPNSGLFKEIVETNAFGEIIIDEKCRTSAPGFYAAGDVTTSPYKQIVIAIGEGAKASLSAFEDSMRGE